MLSMPTIQTKGVQTRTIQNLILQISNGIQMYKINITQKLLRSHRSISIFRAFYFIRDLRQILYERLNLW